MFEIDLEDVDQVLLPDGWHRVLNHSFTIGTCQIGQPKNAADKVSYWQDAASWQEYPGDTTEYICSMIAPLHAIAAIRKRGTK